MRVHVHNSFTRCTRRQAYKTADLLKYSQGKAFLPAKKQALQGDVIHQGSKCCYRVSTGTGMTWSRMLKEQVHCTCTSLCIPVYGTYFNTHSFNSICTLKIKYGQIHILSLN